MYLKFWAFISVLMYQKEAFMTQILWDEIRFGFYGSGGEVTKWV